MDVAQVIELGRESLMIAVMVATPLLGTALAVGLLIGIIQAATSIQEMTLSFIPKLAVMVLRYLLHIYCIKFSKKIFFHTISNLTVTSS